MVAGPGAVANWVVSHMPLSAPPTSITSTILEVGDAAGWFSSQQDADEKAERWQGRVLTRLIRELNDARSGYHPTRFDINDSSPDHVQGFCFVSPSDASDLATSKQRRALQDDYRAAVRRTTPDEFEALSRGLLFLLGCPTPVLTPQSGDQGIDVFGELPMTGRLGFTYTLGGPDQLLSTWIIGQAKRYSGAVGPAEIREFIGSFELLRAKVHTNTTALALYDAKPFQAVHKIFITTGILASGARSIARQAGVIVFDIDRISAMLADHAIATPASSFDDQRFGAWLTSNGR